MCSETRIHPKIKEIIQESFKEFTISSLLIYVHDCSDQNINSFFTKIYFVSSELILCGLPWECGTRARRRTVSEKHS